MPGTHDEPYQAPVLLEQAIELSKYLATLPASELVKCMQISKTKADQTKILLENWTDKKSKQRPAVDAFLGDIYSGLQVQTFSNEDRAYANDHLLILSGLYGGLRALDSIHPYRLEMGYKLPNTRHKSLYDFWGNSIAKLIPATNDIINLSAVEYTKAVLPYIDSKVIAPKFLTVSPKTGEPMFVTVHAKVARGAFARWLIQNRVENTDSLKKFNDLNYVYSESLSTESEPVFICTEFGGIGLSVRLT